MHPDVSWMMYQTEETNRKQQWKQQRLRRSLRRRRLPQQIALWSGKRLFHLAIWLLRYGQPAMAAKNEQHEAWATR